IYFSSDIESADTASNTTESNITEVRLRYCLPGEQLLGDSPWQRCEACKAGWLSLDNSSACLECQSVLDCYGSEACPIECPGGDEYVVCQGAYLAPQAQYCHDPKNLSTQCLLDRFYLCETDAACSTNGGAGTCGAGEAGNAGRVGRGTESVAGLALCNEEEFAGSRIVLCGGQTPVICSDSHYRDMIGGECVECSSRAQVLAMTCAAIVGMVLAAALFAYLLLFAFPGQASVAKEALKRSIVTGEAQATLVQLNKAMNAGSLVIGYLQVMGQISHIYAGEVIPEEIQSYLFFLGFANFDFEAVFNLKCIRYHFLSDLDFSGEFMRNFWQSVSLPWVLCASFTMLYLFILHKRSHRTRIQKKMRKASGITLQPREEWSEQMTEEEWRHNIGSTCMAAALFIMMLFHPSISTITFQLFNCNPVYFDDDSRALQYWLHLDTTVECFTPSWYVAMGFAVFTMATYVVGFPLGLFLMMHHLRQYHQLRMPRHVADQHVALVLDGVWIPCHTEDAVAVRLHGSWFEGGGESWHDADTEFAAISWHDAEPAAPSSESLWKTLEDAAEAEKGDTNEEPDADEVEIFVLRSSFTLLGPLKKQRRLSIRERLREMPAAGVQQGGAGETARIQLKDGQVIEEVFCLQKPEMQFGEDDVSRVMQYTPMTRLDNGHAQRVLGQFRDPFEDEFYYYQCYEICRRVLQTGVVVLFSMVAGNYAALLYALIFSGIAILIHQRYSPYKHDALDNLQLFILMNQFMAQASLLLNPLNLQSSAFGIALVVAQVMLVLYASTLIYPAIKPVIDRLLDKKRAIVLTFRRRPGSFASSPATFLNPAYSDSTQPNSNGMVAC
ncbi:hypothetical protein CYMTET_52444, partial [Cymbomonas tetramitiformis]